LRSNHLAPHGGALKNPPPMRPARASRSADRSVLLTNRRSFSYPSIPGFRSTCIYRANARDEGGGKKGNAPGSHDAVANLQTPRLCTELARIKLASAPRRLYVPDSERKQRPTAFYGFGLHRGTLRKPP
jgi:hypothetical protein